MTESVWYKKYEQLRNEVSVLHERFIQRSQELNASPNRVIHELWKDIVIRAVHESNWQEGIWLERGKTQELAQAAFDDLENIQGPHLDMNKILNHHRWEVVNLKKRGATTEELATFNLSAAQFAIRWIGNELANRQAASLMQALLHCKSIYEVQRGKMPEDVRASIERGFQIIDTLSSSEAPVNMPITGCAGTEGIVVKSLLKIDNDSLLNPMRPAYIHFLHKLVLMGVTPLGKCGIFRNVGVHVGNPDLYFPPPSMVPKLMEEYCNQFPTILPETVKYDPILKAAEASYKFVRIHPYADGNGRVSRLLMNLVLWGHFPPVYLKADKKGRHRYGQALRRADRGDIKPLAVLIAMSLSEIYQKLIAAVNP